VTNEGRTTEEVLSQYFKKEKKGPPKLEVILTEMLILKARCMEAGTTITTTMEATEMPVPIE
jgi:hypothetical protein